MPTRRPGDNRPVRVGPLRTGSVLRASVDWSAWLAGESIVDLKVINPSPADITIGDGVTVPDLPVTTDPTPPAPAQSAGVVTLALFKASGATITDGTDYTVSVNIATGTRADTCQLVFAAYN